MRVHASACVCAWDNPPHTHTPNHHVPPPPGGWTPRISKNLITLELIKIFQFPFEDLKSVKNSPPMGGCMVWWVVGWVDGWDQVKTLKI